MIKISQLKLPIGHSKEELERRIYKLLKLNVGQELSYRIVRRSIDARRKPELFYVYTIHVKVKQEESIQRRAHCLTVTLVKDGKYLLPEHGTKKHDPAPLVIGAGPAGLFCAYLLTECGFSPVIIERGASMEERKKDVDSFWENGVLNPYSNVQFGEGGAGTFSDGKLNSGVKDAHHRNQFVLETFVKFGAPEEILYDNKPHIGTDILADVIVNMRNELIRRGCRFYFKTCAKDFMIENGRIVSVICEDRKFDVQTVVLALGHSARDTFRKLQECLVPMQAKNFAVGFRVEHPQEMINLAMYGEQGTLQLPAAPYKVTSNFPNGRGVYSFCMCPGGYVVNASSEPGKLAVNGMSYSGRNGKNANSAIIVSVGPKDFGLHDALSGMRYQERLEEKAFALGNGKIPQQLYGDYCQNRISDGYGAFFSEAKGRTVFANLRGLLSEEMEQSFQAGMEHFSRLISGFNREDAILSGVESRTSSPVRILRNEELESPVKGIYPCGEGAGFAGGIMSAAMDGMKTAEAIIRKYRPD